MMKSIARIIALWVMIQVSPVSFAEELNTAIEKIANSLGEQMMKQSTKKLAVGNFTDLSGQKSIFGDLISEELVTALSLYEQGKFDVVERRELDPILREQAKYTQPVFDKNTVVKLQKLLGIDVLILGTIAEFGEQVRINARAINVGTGKVFAATKVFIDRNKNMDNLMQQSSNTNSNTGVDAEQGESQKSSNSYFKNKLLHVISTGVVKHDDKKGVRITTKFHNITNEPLYISLPNKGQGSNGYAPHVAFASTELGDLFYLQISGLRPSPADFRWEVYGGKETCTVITPNSFINVVWDLRLQNTYTPIKGSDLTISSDFYNCKDDKPQQFTVQLSGIKLN